MIILAGLIFSYGMDGSAPQQRMETTDTTGFINVSYTVENDGKQAVYQGTLTWTGNSGADGRPARAPVWLYYRTGKQEVPVCGYEPGQDGRFWLRAPDTLPQYSLKVFTELSKDLPEKARKALDNARREKP